MRNSHIIDDSRHPVSPMTMRHYAPQSKEVMDAMSRAQTLGMLAPNYDTSVYEFPGDLTYLRYLGES